MSGASVRLLEARFFLISGTAEVYIDARLSGDRQRNVSDGFREDILVVNHGDEPSLRCDWTPLGETPTP